MSSVLYKPDGVAILATPLVSPSIMKEQQNPFGMGRWTTITINGQKT